MLGRSNDKPLMRYAIIGLIATFVSSCGSPYGDVPLAAPLSYTEGEEALTHGEYSEAARQFRAYLADTRPTYRARAFYQLARAQYLMEDYQGAQTTLATLEHEFPGLGTKQTQALHGDLAYALGEPMDAVLLWETAYEQSTAEEREALQPRIVGAINTLSEEDTMQLAGVLTVPQIYEMAIDQITGTTGTGVEVEGVEIASATADRQVVNDAGPSAALPANLSEGEQLALERAAAAAAIEDAGTALAAPATEADTIVDPADIEPESVVAALAQPTLDETLEPETGIETEAGIHIGPKVAALLPLTGDAREAGRAALQSLRAYFDGATLVVRDTGSNPALAVTLLREFAADRDVIAVLGPIHPPVILAVRRAAQGLDLPVQPQRGASATHVAGSASRALATYAVRERKASRIGILAPAASAATGFAGAATSLGATVVGTHVYDVDEFDINGVLAAVQTWIDTGGVDAVYVADRPPRGIEIAKAARAVAPQLVLLGHPTWNDPAALAAAGAAIDGAVIVGDPPAPPSADDSLSRAAAALQRAIALGETDRSQTRALLGSMAQGTGSSGLLKIVGNTTTSID